MRRRPRSRTVALGGLVSVIAVGVVGACSSIGDSSESSSGFRALPEPLPLDSLVEDSDPPATPAPPPLTVTVAPSTSTSTSTSTSAPTTSTTTTTIDPLTVAHAYPVDPEVNSSFTPQGHSNYHATDVFSSAGCGTALRSPVTGTVDEVVTNTYDRAVDDPATRGGNAVSVVGDDGVRYYLAHFQTIDPAIVAGARVEAGQFLGEMGDTGRAGACHLHFGLSLPCDNGDWWVRRGVIWPDEYLQSWKDGGNLSPLPELQAWFAEYPDACRSVDDTPFPVG